jgi:hypothetical protein
MFSGQMAVMPARAEFVATEVHTAKSQWQYCGCRSCREFRHLIETAPGLKSGKFNFDKYRKADERY